MPVQKQPSGVDIIVGQNLRRCRLLSGLTQTLMGEACGISFQQIQKYEKGTNRISASRLVQFAKLLGQPITTFFDGVEDVDASREQRQDGEVEFFRDRRGPAIISLWPRLDADGRFAVLAVARSLAEGDE